MWGTLVSPTKTHACAAASLLGAVGLLLYMAWTRGLLQRYFPTLSLTAFSAQARRVVSGGAGRNLQGSSVLTERLGAGSLGLEDLGSLVSQRSPDHEHVGMALERLLETLPSEFPAPLRAFPGQSCECGPSPMHAILLLLIS